MICSCNKIDITRIIFYRDAGRQSPGCPTITFKNIIRLKIAFSRVSELLLQIKRNRRYLQPENRGI